MLQDNIQDPDVAYSSFSYDTSDASSTSAALRNSQPDPVPIDDDFEKIMSDMRSMPHLKEMFKLVEENSLKMRSMSQDTVVTNNS